MPNLFEIEATAQAVIATTAYLSGSGGASIGTQNAWSVSYGSGGYTGVGNTSGIEIIEFRNGSTALSDLKVHPVYNYYDNGTYSANRLFEISTSESGPWYNLTDDASGLLTLYPSGMLLETTLAASGVSTLYSRYNVPEFCPISTKNAYLRFTFIVSE